MLDPATTTARSRAVGITKGPGETTHEYTFVSRDDAMELKNGEYVYYELADPDGEQTEPRRVLGRILKRVPLQLYPDTFLAEPEIATGDCRIEWADGGVVLERGAIAAKIDELVGRYIASRKGN